MSKRTKYKKPTIVEHIIGTLMITSIFLFILYLMFICPIS